MTMPQPLANLNDLVSDADDNDGKLSRLQATRRTSCTMNDADATCF